MRKIRSGRFDRTRKSILGPRDTDDLSNGNDILAFTPNTVFEVYIHGDGGRRLLSATVRKETPRNRDKSNWLYRMEMCGFYVRAVHWEDSHRSRPARRTLCKRQCHSRNILVEKPFADAPGRSFLGNARCMRLSAARAKVRSGRERAKGSEIYLER